jgi:DNA processing protein
MTVVDNLGTTTPTRADMVMRGQESVAQADPRYPRRLLKLSQPPPDLWYRGRLPEPSDAGRTQTRTVAIVGARAASARAAARAFQLAAELGQAGFAVVSGGAYGIDAAAHQGALSVGAPTFAVLGCGVDVVYPDRHQGLFDSIADGGGLLTEYPPGTPPRHRQFPARNRIVAALADVVIVVEAARRSGALITARLARDLGIPLVAVPGSAGTDGLLSRARALPDDGVPGVLRALAGADPALCLPPLPQGRLFSPLLEALSQAPDGADGLSRRLGLPLPQVLTQLSQAEIEGWVRRAPGGEYEVTRVQ